ncbi:MAG: hypothetical protein Q7U78_05920 [Gallionella sp.]|nr:hypothetical protein [Gallionella sp.]
MLNLFKTWFFFAIAPLYFGGGGGSSASTSTTNNTDARLVNSGGIGITNSSGLTINALDGGAVSGALDLIAKTNSASAGNYDNLLKSTNDALGGIFSLANTTIKGSMDSLSQSQNNFGALVDTKQSAGTLDNRTITILGISAAVVVGAFAMRRAG